MKKGIKLSIFALTGLAATTAIAISSISFMKVDADRAGRTPEVFTTADSYAYLPPLQESPSERAVPGATGGTPPH